MPISGRWIDTRTLAVVSSPDAASMQPTACRDLSRYSFTELHTLYYNATGWNYEGSDYGALVQAVYHAIKATDADPFVP